MVTAPERARRIAGRLRAPVLAVFLTLVGSAAPLHAQQPRVRVGVRPDRVRVGSDFVITVRIEGAADPDTVAFVGAGSAEIVGTDQRSSTALGRGAASRVLERDYVLRARAPGRVSPEVVRVVSGGDTVDAAVPAVTAVAQGPGWVPPAPRARRQQETPGPRDQGRPPRAEGRDASSADPWGAGPGWYGGAGSGMAGVVPWDPSGAMGTAPWRGGWDPYGATGIDPWSGAWNPYGGGAPDPGAGVAGSGRSPYGTSGWGASGWGASPRGTPWAPTARSDPWWPELIPELDRYTTVAEDPMGLVTLEAGLTPSRVYEGQQVTLVATATFAPEALARFGRSPEFFPPSAEGAWVVDVPYAPPTPAAAGGRVQEAHTFMRAFFPMGPGSLDIAPASLTYRLAQGAVGGPATDTVSTEPLTADVLPVPRSQAPPDWSGAVGRYRIRGWTQPRSVEWGAAALLTVEISGAGNVRALPRPDPGPVWGAELRATGERANVEVRDGVVGGAKTFSWLVVPVEAGRLRIGPVVFSYFDPWIGAFGQVATGEIELDVGPFPGTGARTDPRVPRNAPGRGEAPADSEPVGWEDAVAPSAHAPAPEPSRGDSTGRAGGGEGPTGPGDDTGDLGPGASSMSASPLPASPSRKPAAARGPTAEASIRSLAEAVALRPGDADAWLGLGRAYDTARPDEGWAPWAFASGLRHRPRNRALREALWGTAEWRPSLAPGLPRLPLSSRESAALGSLLLLGGLAVASSLAWRRPATGAWVPRLALTAALLVSASVALEPWWVLRRGDRGVVVEGPAVLRLAPSWSSPEVASVQSGTALRLGTRFGAWIHVARQDGDARGWVESVQVAPLDPVTLRGRGAAGEGLSPGSPGPAPGTPPGRTASPGG